MSRIVLAGATGLIGSHLAPMLIDAGHELHVIGRRDIPGILDGVVQHIADSSKWPDIVRRVGAEIAISCLGTTMKQAGSKKGFRAVDFHLIVAFAEAARQGGTRQYIAVSSVGADADSRNFYLKTKGETELAAAAFGFDRVDFMRPGLLRGDRGGPSRAGESIAIRLSPFTDILMFGSLNRYRSIPAHKVAKSIAALTYQSAPGRFIHENRAIETLAG